MQNDGSISPVRRFFRNKWVRLILAIDVLAIIIIVGILIWNATKDAVINFSIAPIDAKIQIDGHGEYYNGSYQVHPGNHEITISHDGLTTKTFTIDLKSGYNTTLTAFLSGENNNFEFYELKDNYESFQKLAEIASSSDNQTTDQDTSAERFIQTFQQNLQRYQEALPINYIEYKYENEFATHTDRSTKIDIAIKPSSFGQCKTSLCINVTIYIADGVNGIAVANNILTDKGFNLEEYEIYYKNY